MTRMIRLYKALSPAKINLVLRVGPLRKDGFHSVETLMAKMAWGDEIKMKIWQSSDLKINLKCSEPSIENQNNLVVRAAKSFAEKLPVFFECEISIRKKIPMEGGLAGGSSNAAVVLKMLEKWYAAEFGSARRIKKQLEQIAKGLGSDVNFFLSSSNAAWCTGRGEKIKSMSVASWPAVLVFPKSKISTAWAYGKLDQSRKNEPHKNQNKHLLGLSKAGGWKSITSVPKLENDFEEPMLGHFPELARLKKDLARSGAIAGQMTGSGACFFALYFNDKQARAGELYLQSKNWRLQRTRLQPL